jgi:hypothetical protein
MTSKEANQSFSFLNVHGIIIDEILKLNSGAI